MAYARKLQSQWYIGTLHTDKNVELNDWKMILSHEKFKKFHFNELIHRFVVFMVIVRVAVCIFVSMNIFTTKLQLCLVCVNCFYLHCEIK